MSVPTEEEVVRKLEALPIDQLKQLLTEQLDLEVQLKHKQLQNVDRELGKCEGQMVMLRKFFDIPHTTRLENEPHEFAVKYYDLLNNALTTTYTELKDTEEAAIRAQEAAESAISVSQSVPMEFPDLPGAGHVYRTRSLTSLLRPVFSTLIDPNDLGCLFRRTDGVIVKITCRDCTRSNFKSMLMFINHARNAHSKEYGSQDEAALRCGHIIPEIKQDSEGEASVAQLLERGLDPNTNLNLTSTLPELDHKVVKPPVKRARVALALLLMKKMTKDQMTKDQFDELINDARTPVGNAHLFEGEVDGETDESDEGLRLTPEPVSRKSGARDGRRRQSRAEMRLK